MSPKKHTTEIAEFVFANSNGISLADVASGIGISQSYLSEILSGKKEPSIDVGNKIADYFRVPKIKIYKMMGWIDNDPNGDVVLYLIELAKRDAEFVELAKLYANLYTPEDKKRAIRILKSLVNE